MEIGKVFVDSVIVGRRHRALDTSRIEALAESMAALGLQQPITVYMDDKDGAHLIAGLHRLEAARKLRWEQVDASFVKLSPAKREMWEIAENLYRVDLTKEQRDQHIRRYAELVDEAEKENRVVQNEPSEIGYKKPPKAQKGIAQKVAEQTGLSKSTVRRALFKPNPEAQRQQEEAARTRREQDRAIEAVAAEEFATWLLAQCDLDQVHTLIAWIEGSKPKDVIDALRRMTSDVPVMDRSAA